MKTIELWMFSGVSKTKELDLILILLDANFFPSVFKEVSAQILVHHLLAFLIHVNFPTQRKYQVVDTCIDGRLVESLVVLVRFKVKWIDTPITINGSDKPSNKTLILRELLKFLERANSLKPSDVHLWLSHGSDIGTSSAITLSLFSRYESRARVPLFIPTRPVGCTPCNPCQGTGPRPSQATYGFSCLHVRVCVWHTSIAVFAIHWRNSFNAVVRHSFGFRFVVPSGTWFDIVAGARCVRLGVKNILAKFSTYPPKTLQHEGKTFSGSQCRSKQTCNRGYSL